MRESRSAFPAVMLKPMLASLGDAPLEDPQLVYEPKYDGIRAIAEVTPRAARPVRLWSRLGNEKTDEFPEIVAALKKWSTRLKAPVVLDGEIVALDAKGEPTGFQALQRKSGQASSFRAAFIAFDLLGEGSTDWRGRPLVERRAALERVFARATHGRARPILRLSEMARGNGRALYERALASGWEGLVAKRADSRYVSGKRTPDWRKLKIVHEQEFVVGGWTAPHGTRSHFGALLVGVFEEGRRRPVLDTRERSGASASARGSLEPLRGADAPSNSGGGGVPAAVGKGGAPRELRYAGHVGTGFDERELAKMIKRLEPLATSQCPFVERPLANERVHWVRPELVAQIKFTEWTADGRLRHPVYLGLRDDKKARDVVREQTERKPVVRSSSRRPTVSAPASSTPLSDPVAPSDVASGFSRTDARRLIDQLRAIEESRRDGMLLLPDGDRLKVGNLHKIFWPRQKLTKGDLFRYYVEAAPFILPVLADRPLVMKRFPNGVTGQAFYQHEAKDAPRGVRVETPRVAPAVPQFVGGNLKTLLHMTQLAAISQDPWFSRVQSIEDADHAALDLDPAPGVPFDRVLDVARWIHDELDAKGATGVPKTSGADGLHIYVALPPGTPYKAGLLFCQIIATIVVQKHPQVATTERSVTARGARVYIDCLQNILGKTLAAAYSARASDYAGVSMPLSWREIERGVRREDFTIQSVPARLKKVGDLWAALRTAKGVDWSRL